MVKIGEKICPKCGGKLKHYDKVTRIVRGKNGYVRTILLNRSKCSKCSSVHREIPSIIFPYKQYEAEIIRGVILGFITSDVIGFEDYPCEITMIRWCTTHFLQLL